MLLCSKCSSAELPSMVELPRCTSTWDMYKVTKCWCCTLAHMLRARYIGLHEIFECTQFTVYRCKETSIYIRMYTHTRVQCSLACVGARSGSSQVWLLFTQVMCRVGTVNSSRMFVIASHCCWLPYLLKVVVHGFLMYKKMQQSLQCDNTLSSVWISGIWYQKVPSGIALCWAYTISHCPWFHISPVIIG